MITKTIAIALFLCSFVCTSQEQIAGNDVWVDGFWRVTNDESQDSSLGEIVEFRHDRSVVLWDSSCNSENRPEELSYRVDRDAIFVTNHLPGKDHASFSLYPDQSKTKLTLIWPENGNKTTLTRMPGPGCPEEHRDPPDPPLDPSSGLDLSPIAKKYTVPRC